MSEQVNYVKEGAGIYCTKGSSKASLKVPVNHGVKIQGSNQATIMDSKTMVNIPSFGTCKAKYPPVPCAPSICMHWLKGEEDYKICNEPALLNKCVLPCVQGGVIRIG